MDGIVEAEIERTTGPWREAWRGFRKNKVAVVGMVIVLFFILLAIFGPLIAKEGINEQLHADRLQPPSAEYWLGTDDFGRRYSVTHYPRGENITFGRFLVSDWLGGCR